MAWEAESRTAGGSFYVDRLLFYIQQSIEPVANLCGKLLVTIMLCKVADIREALVAVLEFAFGQIIVLDEEFCRNKEFIGQTARKVKSLVSSTGIVIGLDHVDDHILVRESQIGHIERIVLGRNSLLTLIKHLHGTGRVTDLEHLLSHIHKDLSLRKHATECIEVLIIHKIVSPLECIPGEDILHLVV